MILHQNKFLLIGFFIIIILEFSTRRSLWKWQSLGNYPNIKKNMENLMTLLKPGKFCQSVLLKELLKEFDVMVVQYFYLQNSGWFCYAAMYN